MSNSNSYTLVKNHPRVGKTITFKYNVVGVYKNPDTGSELVKLEAPNGKTQVRRYGSLLYQTVDLDE